MKKKYILTIMRLCLLGLIFGIFSEICIATDFESDKKCSIQRSTEAANYQVMTAISKLKNAEFEFVNLAKSCPSYLILQKDFSMLLRRKRLG